MSLNLLRKNLKTQKFYIRVLLFFALIYYKTIGTINYNLIDNKEKSEKLLLTFYKVSFNPLFLLFIIVPCFLILIDNFFFKFFNQYKVFLRYKNLKIWWKDKLLSQILFSFVFTLLLNILFIINLIIKGAFFHINLNFIVYILSGIVLQFIGFSLLSNIYQILTYIIRNRNFAFIVIFLLTFTPFSLNSFFIKNIYSLPEYMFLTNLKEIKTVISNMVTIIPILLCIHIITVSLSYFIIKNKDLYWRN